MSRRDTIIIAMLVNAGLLALLFMLAVNTDDEVIVDHPEITKAIVDNRSVTPVTRPQAPIILLDTSVNDEVDNFLKDLAAEDPKQALLLDDEGYLTIRSEPSPIATKPDASPIATTNVPVKKDTSIYEEVNYVEVTVKRGDALEKIARSNGTTVEAIKKANNLSTAKLSIGQVLRVPLTNKIAKNPKQDAISVQTIKEPEKKFIANSDIQYYTVKSGDNPWKIAKQFNVKFEDLLKLNNLDEERARNLKIGDKVRVK